VTYDEQLKILMIIAVVGLSFFGTLAFIGYLILKYA